jgi:hypothetical protein
MGPKKFPCILRIPGMSFRFEWLGNVDFTSEINYGYESRARWVLRKKKKTRDEKYDASVPSVATQPSALLFVFFFYNCQLFSVYIRPITQIQWV